MFFRKISVKNQCEKQGEKKYLANTVIRATIEL